MSRIQLALNVEDLEASIAFYSRLFDSPPAKVKPGYANFAVADPPLKLVLIESPGHGGSINHLGVEVADTDAVDAAAARLAAEGLGAVQEREQTCCYATQTKLWVQGSPDGEQWEVYTVLDDSETFAGESSDDAGDHDRAEPDRVDRPGPEPAGTLDLESRPPATPCCA